MFVAADRTQLPAYFTAALSIPPRESNQTSIKSFWPPSFSFQKLRNSGVPVDMPVYVWKNSREKGRVPSIAM